MEGAAREIDVHPEARRMRDEIAAANGRLADLLMEIDDIKLQQNPQIEADYAVKVGYLENELLAKQIEARRARRSLELARARVNRGEALDTASLAAIEAQLDRELGEWKRRLQVALNRAQEMLDRRAHSVAMSGKEVRELKRLYRELAKWLHPDLNPEQGDRERKLFAIAQSMYGHGDLEGLRALHATVMAGDAGSHGPGDLSAGDVLDILETELMAAHGRVEAMEGQLAELKADRPYCWREKLADPAWIVARSEELGRAMAESERAAASYRAKLDALREGYA